MRSFILSACSAILISSLAIAQKTQEQTIDINRKGVLEYEKQNYEAAVAHFREFHAGFGRDDGKVQTHACSTYS